LHNAISDEEPENTGLYSVIGSGVGENTVSSPLLYFFNRQSTGFSFVLVSLYLVMATFGGLFDFPDLSADESELSLPLNSSELEDSEEEEDEDAWYNQPSNSEDSDDDSLEPCFTLPTSSAFILPKTIRKEHSTGARIKAIYMLEQKKSATKILEATGVSRTRAYALAAVARERGWRENEDMPLEVLHVLNQPRSGRPAVSPDAIKCVLKVVLQNSTTRGFSCGTLAKEVKKRGHEVAPRTVWKILTQAGYSQCKLTVKPGLNKFNKKERYDWCKERESWGLEEWKNVIFTDETAVQLGGTRGKQRVWRLPGEAYNKHCIKRRWKGFSEFMFWGSFSYDKKGPCHVWEKETAKEKKERKADLDARNKKMEKNNKRKWEKEQKEWLRNWVKAHGRNPGGTRKIWKHDESTGAFVVKNGRGGINWYRYQKKILIEKLLPFAKECQKDRPDTLVQEDNAPAHKSHYQGEVYSLWKIMKMLWPANSPDLNAIEKAWYWMKRQTTKKGPTSDRKKLRIRWEQCWEELPQKMIQSWIEAIPGHVKEIIRLGGGNEYKEGRKKGQEQVEIYS
jgi:transposase